MSNDGSATQPAAQPVPPRTVADVARITTNKTTDLLAFVKSVTRDRKSKSGEDIADVVLLDDSKTDPFFRAAITVGVFGSKKIARLKEHVGTPMVFFNLSVSVAQGSVNINHYTQELISDAPKSLKTMFLTTNQKDLAAAENTKSITTGGPRDVSGPQPISCAAFLDFTSSNAHAKMPDVCQVMWVHCEEPEPGDNVTVGTDAAAQRVWFRTRLRDATGATMVNVPERMALKLTNCSDMKTFVEKHAAANLNWPLLCHTRLSRAVREVDSAVYVNHTLEEVLPVSWSLTEAPNAAYLSLLQIVNMCPAHDESILFAFLSDIQENHHYGFEVIYDGHPASKCTYVLALIASASRSTTANVGEGYQVSTSSVQDFANPSAGAAKPSCDDASESAYSVLGFCTLDNLPAFRLDPPRGKAIRCAVCVISRREGKAFHIHKLECLEPDQQDTAVQCFRKLRKLCSSVRPSSTEKRSHDVTVAAEACKPEKKQGRSMLSLQMSVSSDRAFQPAAGHQTDDASQFVYTVAWLRLGHQRCSSVCVSSCLAVLPTDGNLE